MLTKERIPTYTKTQLSSPLSARRRSSPPPLKHPPNRRSHLRILPDRVIDQPSAHARPQVVHSRLLGRERRQLQPQQPRDFLVRGAHICVHAVELLGLDFLAVALLGQRRLDQGAYLGERDEEC